MPGKRQGNSFVLTAKAKDGVSPVEYAIIPSRTVLEFHSSGNGSDFTPSALDVTVTYKTAEGGVPTPHAWPAGGSMVVGSETWYFVWRRYDSSGQIVATYTTEPIPQTLGWDRTYKNSNGSNELGDGLIRLDGGVRVLSSCTHSALEFAIAKKSPYNITSEADIVCRVTVPIRKVSDGNTGSNGDMPIACYRWYKEGLSPEKPTDVSKDAPDAVDCLNDAMKAQPTDRWSDTAANRPADGWHLWMCQSTKHTSKAGVVTRDAWSSPVRLSGDKGSPGEDASDVERIYKKSPTVITSIPNSNEPSQAGYVPSGWTNHPQGTDSTNTYEFMCYRTKNAGTGTRSWSAWKGKTDGASGDAPIIWSHWGRNGMDGDGMEYVFIRTIGNTPPKILYQENNTSYIYNNAHYANLGNNNELTLPKEDKFRPIANVADGTIEQNAFNANGYDGNTGSWTAGRYGECTDNPKGISAEWPYEWAMKRTKGAVGNDGTREWNAYGGTANEAQKQTMSLWGKWGADGESPWIADGNNKMDSVGCDDTGRPVKTQTVQTVLTMYHGAETPSFTVSVKRNGMAVTVGTAQTVPATENGVKVVMDGTTMKVTYYKEAVISGRDDYEVTLTSGTVERVTHFIVNGIRGDVYNLKPSTDQIVADYDGESYKVNDSATVSVSCGYTKNVDGVVSEGSVASGMVDGLYYIYYRTHARGGSWGEWTLCTGSLNLNVNTNDILELALCTGLENSQLKNMIDDEDIHVVSNGRNGSSSQDEATAVYGLLPKKTEVNFRTDAVGVYGPEYVDVGIGYVKSEGSSQTSGDWQGNTNESGEASDAGSLIDGKYRVIWRKIAGEALTLEPESGVTVNVAAGSPVPTFYNSSTHAYAQANGWDWEYASSTGSSSLNNTGLGVFKGNGKLRVYRETKCLDVEFALVASSVGANTASDSDIIARATVPIIFDGRRGAQGQSIQGATGRSFFPMGIYSDLQTYTKTELEIPLVFYDDDVWNDALECYGSYWKLDADTNVVNGVHYGPENGSAYWSKASHFGLVITQGIFASFAKLAKCIYSGDYRFSTNGRIGNNEYVLGETYGNTDIPAYMWFRGDPDAEVRCGDITSQIGCYGGNQDSSTVNLGDVFTLKQGMTLEGTLQCKVSSGTDVVVRLFNAKTGNIVYFSANGSNTSSILMTSTMQEVPVSYAASSDMTLQWRVVNTSPYSAMYRCFYAQLNYKVNGVFVPNLWEDMLTGKICAARGNFVVGGNGSVRMNNAEIRGSLMYHKVGYAYGVSSFDNCDNNYRLIYDTLVIRGWAMSSGFSTMAITLPPAKNELGATVKIINGYNGSQIQTIELFVIAETVNFDPNDAVPGSTDAPQNRFFDPLAGNHVASIDMTEFASIELTAVEGPFYHYQGYSYKYPDNIVWMITGTTQKI